MRKCSLRWLMSSTPDAQLQHLFVGCVLCFHVDCCPACFSFVGNAHELLPCCPMSLQYGSSCARLEACTVRDDVYCTQRCR
jgi:hypothetical protein